MFAAVEREEAIEDRCNRAAYNTAALASAAVAGKLKDFKSTFPKDKDKILTAEQARQYKAGMDKMSSQLKNKILRPSKTSK